MSAIASKEVRSTGRPDLKLIYAPFLFVALVSFLTLELKEPAKASPMAFVLALLYGVSISVVFLLLGVKAAREKDEFQRKMLLEALLWGTVITLVVSTIWGSLETFTNIHHMPGIFNFGIFILVFAIAKVAIFRSNAVGDS